MEKNALILEISGEKGEVKQYQEVLAEASLIGIENVYLAFNRDSDKKNRQRSLQRLTYYCDVLDMQLLSFAGYYGSILEEPMIGSLDSYGNLTATCYWKEFSEYKESKGIAVESAKVHKVLVKM